MKSVLATDRLLIREFDPGDAEAFFQLGHDPQVIRFTHDPGGGFLDVDQAREVLLSHPIHDYATRGYGRWACVHREERQVIGFAGLKYLDDLQAVDIGYRFLPQYWGQGLATEAARAVLHYGFSVLKLDEVIGLVLPDNPASARVLEKIGMHRFGQIDYDGVAAVKYVASRPD